MSVRKIKSFTPKKKEDREPIRFQILDEEFEAVPVIPGITLLEFVSAGASNDDEEGSGNGASAKGILDYLKASMKKAEYKRFYAFVSAPENEIEIDTLSEIVSYLIEAQASRPTKAS